MPCPQGSYCNDVTMPCPAGVGNTTGSKKNRIATLARGALVCNKLKPTRAPPGSLAARHQSRPRPLQGQVPKGTPPYQVTTVKRSSVRKVVLEEGSVTHAVPRRHHGATTGLLGKECKDCPRRLRLPAGQSAKPCSAGSVAPTTGMGACTPVPLAVPARRGQTEL